MGSSLGLVTFSKSPFARARCTGSENTLTMAPGFRLNATQRPIKSQNVTLWCFVTVTTPPSLRMGYSVLRHPHPKPYWAPSPWVWGDNVGLMLMANAQDDRARQGTNIVPCGAEHGLRQAQPFAHALVPCANLEAPWPLTRARTIAVTALGCRPSRGCKGGMCACKCSPALLPEMAGAAGESRQIVVSAGNIV